MFGTIKVIAKGDQIISEEIPEGFDRETSFRIASVSKQFTAISLLILVDDSLLSLDDPVSDHLPELSWSKSNLIHLLSHTSDIEDCYHLTDENVQYRNEDLLPLIQSNGYLPDEQYIYCNTGYDLIPIIVERIVGKPYSEFLQERIFDPLGMTRTFTSQPDHNFAPSDEKYTVKNLNHILGSGGIYSCVNDLIRWNLGMSSLISDEMCNMAKSEITTNYGLGLEVYPDHIAHSGCWENYNCYLAFYPEGDISVIVLSNVDEADATKIGKMNLIRTIGTFSFIANNKEK